MAERQPLDEDTVALFSSPATAEFASQRRAASFQPTEYTRQLLAEAVRLSKESGEPTTMGAIVEAAVLSHLCDDPKFTQIQDEAVRSIEYAHERELRRTGNT